MPETSRPSLPTSSSDFALPPTTTGSAALTLSIPTAADLNPFMLRIRRPSLLSPRVSYFPESRIHSPLATTQPLSRRPSASTSGSTNGEESESDKEKMSTDSPPLSDSGNATPSLLPPPIGLDSGRNGRVKPTERPRSPTTPPPRNSTSISELGATQDIVPRRSPRRPSHPVST